MPWIKGLTPDELVWIALNFYLHAAQNLNFVRRFFVSVVTRRRSPIQEWYHGGNTIPTGKYNMYNRTISNISMKLEVFSILPVLDLACGLAETCNHGFTFETSHLHLVGRVRFVEILLKDGLWISCALLMFETPWVLSTRLHSQLAMDTFWYHHSSSYRQSLVGNSSWCLMEYNLFLRWTERWGMIRPPARNIFVSSFIRTEIKFKSSSRERTRV